MASPTEIGEIEFSDPVVQHIPPSTVVLESWKSDEIHELSTALAKAQGAIGHAERTATNPHYNSRYPELKDVIDAIRKPFADNGLSVVQLPANDADVARLTTVLLHSSGQWVSSRIAIRPTKADPQGLTGAFTYARRTALASIAGVAATDDDGNTASAAPRKKAAKKKADPVQEAQQWAEDQQSDANVISEAQARRLFAISKAAGRDQDDVKAYLISKGYTSSREIRREDYDEIVAWVEKDAAVI